MYDEQYTFTCLKRWSREAVARCAHIVAQVLTRTKVELRIDSNNADIQESTCVNNAAGERVSRSWNHEFYRPTSRIHETRLMS